MNVSKKNLREIFFKKRKLVKERAKKERVISKKIFKLFLNNFLITSVYYSVRSEVNLNSYIKLMHKNQQRIVLPVIIKKNSHLLFRVFDPSCELHIDKYGIKIPVTSNLLNPNILLVPMLAFDKNKNRLGYGGGFYDRTIEYLEKYNNVLKVGIAFDEQESENIPIRKFDKKMDVIITQSRIII